MTDVEICNVGLGLLGAELIASMDDTSTEARLCKSQYALVRDAVLEERAWSFALRRQVLDTPAAPAPASGFTTAFTLPTDIIRVLKADDGTGAYDIPWHVEGRLLLCNLVAVYIESVVRPASEALFSPGFCQAFATRLAAELAVPITQSRELQADLWKLYEAKVRKAAATDGLQGSREPEKFSRLSRSRYV